MGVTTGIRASTTNSNRRKSFGGNDLGWAGAAPQDVSPLWVTTYDYLEKLSR